MISKDQRDEIERFCIEFYKKQNLPHGLKHMKRTIKIAEYIARQEGAKIPLVYLGAMLHQFHDNLDELDDFLGSINLNKEDIDKLLDFARFRPHKTKFDVPIEVKVVSDADYLQALGPAGIIREIILNSKYRNKLPKKSVDDARKVETMLYKSLQTKTAKELIKKPRNLMKEFWQIYDEWEKRF